MLYQGTNEFVSLCLQCLHENHISACINYILQYVNSPNSSINNKPKAYSQQNTRKSYSSFFLSCVAKPFAMEIPLSCFSVFYLLLVFSWIIKKSTSQIIYPSDDMANGSQSLYFAFLAESSEAGVPGVQLALDLINNSSILERHSLHYKLVVTEVFQN